jgi:hypothetical protein
MLLKNSWRQLTKNSWQWAADKELQIKSWQQTADKESI